MHIIFLLLIPLSTAFDAVMFGDWGCKGPSGERGVNYINQYLVASPPESVFLLGDNFYSRGIDPKLGVRDPRFGLFSELLTARTGRLPFFVTLGNHDIEQGSRSAMAQVEYSAVNRQWIMPNRNFLQKFSAGVCVWFFDSSERAVSRETIAWLRRSLSDTHRECIWRIFATHVPIVTKGQYRSSGSVRELRGVLQPIIVEFGINLFVSGHEHNSQVLRDSKMPGCIFVVVGAVCERRSKSLDPKKGKSAPTTELIWGDDTHSPVVARIRERDGKWKIRIIEAQREGAEILYEKEISR